MGSIVNKSGEWRMMMVGKPRIMGDLRNEVVCVRGQ